MRIAVAMNLKSQIKKIRRKEGKLSLPHLPGFRKKLNLHVEVSIMVPKKRKRKENEVTQCCLEIFINIQYLCCVCVGGAGCTNTKIHLFSTFFFLANLTTR